MSSTPELLAAVDVGTGSARAGVFAPDGRMLGRAEAAIETQGDGNRAEQSSEAIWAACGTALRAARAEATARSAAVAGLAFDATCSLVLRDGAGQPLAASPDGADRWDTIAWFDHRALAESEACTASGHPLLDGLGGSMSPEMQIPKLMWLKRHLPGTWARLGAAFDLADFLAWRATGTPARSLCTLACKWSYRSDAPAGWPRDFLAAMDLADLPRRAALPEAAVPPGTALGPLLPQAAAALGLAPGIPVAAGLIDAHAGALGVLGHLAGTPALERSLALIAGTSSCLMALSPDRRPAPGLWGPQLGAILPGLWLTEGGQSVSGALLDHVLRLHGQAAIPETHALVIARVRELRTTEPDLAPRLHVLSDFHGNRSPLADPRALGVISGLPFDASFDALCRLYWRTCVGIALGLRHVLETFAAHDFGTDGLHITGGHTRNPLLMELYADATRRPMVEPTAPDAVLLGTAMVAATGAGLHTSLAAAAQAMHQGGRLRPPGPARYERDWEVFRAMLRHRAEVDALLH
jgi:FGGY-family pentulose kinase